MRANAVLKEINNLENKIKKCTDEQLKNKTYEFKKRLNNNAKGYKVNNSNNPITESKLNIRRNGSIFEKHKDTNNEIAKTNFSNRKKLLEILPEAYAVVREAARRVTGKRLYDVQIMAGYVLNEGGIAEIKAGEGKSIIASLPAYLNALDGKGVHIVTTNEYLAKRDYEEIGKIFEFLGLSVGLICQNMKTSDRKNAYQKDITYGTNTEFGFDYLRDHIAPYPEDVVQRELNYAIIDEADSILLDETETPMIISRKEKNFSKEPYLKANRFVNALTGITITKEEPKNKKQLIENEKYDYVVDLTNKTAELTQKGIQKAEKEYAVSNFYAEENASIINDVRQALRANEILKKDVDYIVQNDSVYLIDKFTGRIMYGKKFTKGLQQAIEAKENLKISEVSGLVATISTQNYFKLYNKLSGMTGTAKASREEFEKIYCTDVISIKTNKKTIRKDKKDRVFATEEAKYEAIIEEVKESQKKKQPVLIGTTSIEKSERLSQKLSQNNLKHNVLNAKKYKEEAEIVKEAGRAGKITIATNMAGRGTNILLGGASGNFKDHKKVANAGGLKVIGTEKNDSRRVDEQLRGRSGRQGEVGESVFYVSLEDELIKIYGNRDKIDKYKRKYSKKKNIKINKLNNSSNNHNNKSVKYFEIKNIFVNKQIKKAQQKAENRGYSIRKRLVYYDDILGSQRNLIYMDRDKVLNGNIDEVIENFISYFCEYILNDNSEKSNAIINRLEEVENLKVQKENLEKLKKKIYNRYLDKKELIGKEKYENIQKQKLLKTIDEEWIEHLERMEEIEQGIELQLYGKYNPVEKYAVIAKREFDHLVMNIKLNTVTQLMFLTDYNNIKEVY